MYARFWNLQPHVGISMRSITKFESRYALMKTMDLAFAIVYLIETNSAKCSFQKTQTEY